MVVFKLSEAKHPMHDVFILYILYIICFHLTCIFCHEKNVMANILYFNIYIFIRTILCLLFYDAYQLLLSFCK